MIANKDNKRQHIHMHMHKQGEGLPVLLAEGAAKGSWPADFAAKHTFSADPVIPLPDVALVELDAATDEFLVIATDGLWDAMPQTEAIRYARCAATQMSSSI